MAVVAFFPAMPGRRDPTDEPQPNGGTPSMGVTTLVRRLAAAFKPYPWRSALIFLGLLIEMAWTAIIPKSFQHLIDRAIAPQNYDVLVQVLVFLSVGAVLVTVVGLARDYLYVGVSTRIITDLRLRLFGHLQTLSLSFHDRHSTGQIAARFSSDLESVRQALDSWVTWLILPALEVTAANIILFTIDWRLALIAQLIWPLALLGPRLIAPRAIAAAYRYKQEEGQVLANVSEVAGGRAVIKAFGLEGEMLRTFALRVGGLRVAGVRMGLLSSLLERSSGMGIVALHVIVLGVGGSLAFRGEMTVGALVAFESLFVTMSYALLYIAQYTPELSEAAAGMSRLDEILEETAEVAEPEHPTPLPPLADAITLEGVTFSYAPARKALDDVSLSIRNGESVAFVGSSGSGKSTLLSLLMRFHDPQGGRVCYDGIDLRKAARRALVDQIGVVFQESYFFDVSLRENLRLGRLDATDTEIEAAARAADVHDTIMALPKGYDTPAGERGGAISGGQRQRLAIARALLRDPRVLFLDEATSALDPATEQSINETVRRVAEGRTVVSVTHRLSSVRDADRIFVLHGGRLVESGSHADLIARGGRYAELWMKQSGLGISADGSEATVTPERLRAIPLLTTIDDAVLSQLAEHLLVSESVPAGRDLVVEGDPGSKFYLIVRGSVAVTRRTPEGEHRLAVLEDGDYFGERALLNDTPRTATVTTLTPTSTLTLSRGHFITLLAQVPGLRERLEAEHAEREERTLRLGSDAP